MYSLTVLNLIDFSLPYQHVVLTSLSCDILHPAQSMTSLQFKGDQASAYFEELVQGGPAGGGSNERGDLPGRVGQLEEELRQRDKTIRELQVCTYVGGWVGVACRPV